MDYKDPERDLELESTPRKRPVDPLAAKRQKRKHSNNGKDSGMVFEMEKFPSSSSLAPPPPSPTSPTPSSLSSIAASSSSTSPSPTKATASLHQQPVSKDGLGYIELQTFNCLNCTDTYVCDDHQHSRTPKTPKSRISSSLILNPSASSAAGGALSSSSAGERSPSQISLQNQRHEQMEKQNADYHHLRSQLPPKPTPNSKNRVIVDSKSPDKKGAGKSVARGQIIESKHGPPASSSPSRKKISPSGSVSSIVSTSSTPPTQTMASSTNIICRIHQLELSLICLDDQQFICDICLLSGNEHYQHQTKSISVTYEEDRKDIARSVAETWNEIERLENAIKEVDAVSVAIDEADKFVHNKFSSYFTRAHESLYQWEEKLRTQLTKMTKEKEKSLKQQRANLAYTQTKMKEICLDLKSGLEKNSEAEVLILSQRLKTQVEKIHPESGKLSLEPITNEEIPFDERDLPPTLARSGIMGDFKTSALHSVASGAGIEKITPGQTTFFTIIAKDRKGRQRPYGGDDFAIETKRYDELKMKLIDNKDGSYTVAYTPLEISKSSFVVSIYLRGRHIKGSPYRVQCCKEKLEGRVLRHWGQFGTGKGDFNFPSQIDIDADGFVYVVDTSNNRIQVFDRDGTFVRTIGSSGTSEGHFDRPWAIKIDPNGSLYVTDIGNNRIQVLSKGGQFLHSWKTRECFGICLDTRDNNGQIYVTDCISHSIQVFTKGGVLVRQWGTHGSSDGEFSSPHAIAMDDDDANLYVIDRNNHRIQVFTTEGKFLRKFGGKGFQEGLFDFPDGLTIVGDYLYVSDCYNRRIQILEKKDGKFLGQWGSSGVGSGQFGGNLYGMVVYHGEMFLVDCNNHRIQVFT